MVILTLNTVSYNTEMMAIAVIFANIALINDVLGRSLHPSTVKDCGGICAYFT